MLSSIKAFIILAVTYAAVVTAKVDLSPSEIADIFKTYDTEVDDEPECQPESIDIVICPEKEEIPCAPLDEIESYCAELLGKDIANEMKNVSKKKGMNAMEGCMKYVGFHVIEEDHLACCPSDTCEDWLEEKFSNLEGYYDDDDDYYTGEEF